RIAGEVAVLLPRPRDRRDPALGRARSEVLTLLNGAQQDYHDIAPDIAAAPPAPAPVDWSKLSFAV
ncbi:MAG: ABC transporter ATP-binding protein, partial [Zoogloea sp.]|nr:ABC transporter ATP-binding protein [Zoogloea sp.]